MERSSWACYAYQIIWFFERFVLYNSFVSEKNIVQSTHWLNLRKKFVITFPSEQFVFFLDLKKAFDTLDFQIILDKLYNYGRRGVRNDWFKNYLSNRTQYVEVNIST